MLAICVLVEGDKKQVSASGPLGSLYVFLMALPTVPTDQLIGLCRCIITRQHQAALPRCSLHFSRHRLIVVCPPYQAPRGHSCIQDEPSNHQLVLNSGPLGPSPASVRSKSRSFSVVRWMIHQGKREPHRQSARLPSTSHAKYAPTSFSFVSRGSSTLG